MKNTFLSILAIAFFAIQALGQKSCDIKQHYEDFISIEKATYGERSYLVKKVVTTNSENCFSKLVNGNTALLDYILKNFSSNDNYQELLALPDSTSLKSTYFAGLRKEDTFNSLMNELVSKSVERTTPKDSISMDDLLNIGVKYFSIMKLTEQGDYAGKVCVGLNDIKSTEKQRDPFVEAFCFSSIRKHYRGEEFSMHQEFVNALKELYKVNLGLDPEEKLLRAQGAMFLLMRNNGNLRRMLQKEYELHKEYLPFVLVYS